MGEGMPVSSKSAPPDLFSFDADSESQPAGLPIYRVLSLIPLDRRITSSELLELVWQKINRRATYDQLKEALWDLVVTVGLQLVPDYSGEYTIYHTDRSGRLYLDLNCTVTESPEDILLRTMIPGQGERKNEE